MPLEGAGLPKRNVFEAARVFWRFWGAETVSENQGLTGEQARAPSSPAFRLAFLSPLKGEESAWATRSDLSDLLIT